MRRITVYLDEEQTAALDERARAEGISRAKLIRRIIAREFEETDAHKTRGMMRRATEKSFGALVHEEFDDLHES